MRKVITAAVTGFLHQFHLITGFQCCGSELVSLVSVRIWIQLFTSMRIRLHSQTNADPGSGQTLPSLKVMGHRTYLRYVGTKAFLKGWKSGLLLVLVHFLAPRSGSALSIRILIRTAKPLWIRNRIHNTTSQYRYLYFISVGENIFVYSLFEFPFMSCHTCFVFENL
jgi:hypothetical protein